MVGVSHLHIAPKLLPQIASDATNWKVEATNWKVETTSYRVFSLYEALYEADLLHILVRKHVSNVMLLIKASSEIQTRCYGKVCNFVSFNIKLGFTSASSVADIFFAIWLRLPPGC